MTLFIDRARAASSGRDEICPETIEIAFLNNMADPAIRSSEQQFARLLGAASNGLDVRLSLYEMPELPRQEWARSELLSDYRPVAELLGGRADGLIVTGCEPRAATLQDEPFWEGLSQVIDWAGECALSTIWSCLAAHAAVLRMDGVERRAFDTKLSGVFECEKHVDHELVVDLPQRWMVPHSRQYGVSAGDLSQSGYALLTMSSVAGADIFVKRRRSLDVLFQGHLEYEADSLLREYLRDITRYLENVSDAFPEAPCGLLSDGVLKRFDELKAAALVSKSVRLMTMAPVAQARAELHNVWWTPAVLPVPPLADVDRGSEVLAKRPARAARHAGGAVRAWSRSNLTRTSRGLR